MIHTHCVTSHLASPLQVAHKQAKGSKTVPDGCSWVQASQALSARLRNWCCTFWNCQEIVTFEMSTFEAKPTIIVLLLLERMTHISSRCKYIGSKAAYISWPAAKFQIVHSVKHVNGDRYINACNEGEQELLPKKKQGWVQHDFTRKSLTNGF